MRCFLIGSKELSVQVLDELVRQGHDVLGVLTRDYEDGMRVWLNELGHRSLKARAIELGIPTYERININAPEMLDALAGLRLDALFSVFWGEIVKTPVLTLPRLGCFNLHTAYLPRNRGSFPMAWAIVHGEPYAGAALHRMLPGVDDGPVVARVKTPIDVTDTGESLYRKVTGAAIQMFRENLASLADGSFDLTPQCGEEASYNPRGYPYGGQIDPYWPPAMRDRFQRALYFPPFDGAREEPGAVLQGCAGPGLRIMLGFDCDRPRGSFVVTDKGCGMAERKIASLERIASDLNRLGMPRTFFICGQFLETMFHKYGAGRVRNAFDCLSPSVEVADHTYSHTVIKKVATRPDKNPMPPKQVLEEYKRNTALFQDILGLPNAERGYRAPLGCANGLQSDFAMQDRIKKLGAPYVSSDLRGPGDGLHPKPRKQDGTPRQPYRYPNGLLEIPSVGWQDTVFSGTTATAIQGMPPQSFEETIRYYRELFTEAAEIAQEYQRDYFLGLVLHPYDVSLYDEPRRLFDELHAIVIKLGGSFCTYGAVAAHYNEGF